MSTKPIIFLSAVSRELRSARQLVANNLTFLGFEPDWQDIFGAEQGDVRTMLRRRIDASAGVVQIVGYRYGAEPPVPDEKFGRVSYTQYEALYAKQRGKPLWLLFIDETFVTDPQEPEPAELRQLQYLYRQKIQGEEHLFVPLKSHEGLEASVLKLRGELGRLRRRTKQFAVLLFGLLSLVALGVFFLVRGQRSQSESMIKQGQHIELLLNYQERLQIALKNLPAREIQVSAAAETVSPGEKRARAYDQIEKDLGFTRGALAKDLPELALTTYNNPGSAPLARARAAYVIGKFEEAEGLSLNYARNERDAHESGGRASDERRKTAVEAYNLAGNAAFEGLRYNDAMRHYKEAEMLTDQSRDPEEWAAIQGSIGLVARESGKYSEAEVVFKSLLSLHERMFGPDCDKTLVSRRELAGVLYRQEKYSEAEHELLVALEGFEKTLGLSHRETINCVNVLAVVLSSKGDGLEAETRFRQALKWYESNLGPEDSGTLMVVNNLGHLLMRKKDYDAAEAMFRRALAGWETDLGIEHPATLKAVENLGEVLCRKGESGSAEALYRRALTGGQKVLGDEHPDTLRAVGNLGRLLKRKGDYQGACQLLRAFYSLSTACADALGYNLACYECLIENTTEAKRLLYEYLKRHPKSKEQALSDPDFASIKEDIANM
jgi:tetratricopeptide (TPR) repeat protein